MEIHKLLARQVRKFIPDGIVGNDQLEKFLQAVSDSYYAYERDKELSSHAFTLSEKEYDQINVKLKEEIAARKISIDKLNETIRHLDEDANLATASGDLVSIVEYVKQLVAKTRQSESALSQNVKRITSLINNLNSGVLVENENREIVFTNDVFCKMFGIPASPEQLIGADCSESAEDSKILFSDPQEFIEKVDILLKERKLVRGDILELKDGRFFERDFVPVFLNNQYKGHLWNYSDITQKKKILDALAESEAKNRLIMNSALDAIITIDEEGYVNFWNSQAEKIFGWKESEVLNRELAELIIPERMREAHAKGMQHFKKTMNGPVLNRIIELPALRKTGEEFPVELSITPVNFEGKIIFCSFIRDISERKKSELILAASEEKYRSIIANMNLGLLEVDEHDTIQFCNQSFMDISGYNLEELKGRHAAALFATDQGIARVNEKQKLRLEGKSDSYELVVKDKHGNNRWWLISGAPNQNDKGEFIGTIGIHLDITEQKRMERDLENALHKAKIASNAKESFLANMSHEIRTPLNAIIGMIREMGREELTPHQKSYLSNSETAAKHLLSMVNNILDMSRIEAGKVDFENIDFSIDSVINMVHSILHIKAREKNLKLITKMAPDISPALIGDSGRIRQILINIVGNAIKYTEAGSVELSVNIVESSEEVQKLAFLISDTGIGMTEDFLSTVFEKYSREELESSDRSEGTGLGMNITREIVSLMGGTMHVYSEKEKGTSVELILSFPIGDPGRLLSRKAEDIDDRLKGLHCLLVEDNAMNRLIANRSLQSFGCRVTEAENGKNAIEILKENTFDFILMDVQMPVMNGIETTRYIREDLKFDVPVIALTANVFKSDIELYLSIGMNDFVTKPFDEHHLFSAIANSLTGRPPVSMTNDTGLFNLAKLEVMGRGDKGFIQKMTSLFVKIGPESIAEMQAAVEAADLDSVARTIHRIKPSFDSLGMQQALELAGALEQYLNSGEADLIKVKSRLNELDVIIHSVIRQLEVR